MEVSLILQFRAMAASTANSTALRFRTGNAPGRPRHTGHTFVFGGSPKRVEQEQKILLAVSSWTWTSNPMTGSYLARGGAELSTEVAISLKNYRAAADENRGATGALARPYELFQPDINIDLPILWILRTLIVNFK